MQFRFMKRSGFVRQAIRQSIRGNKMPHVDIKCFSGRSDAQKTKCAGLVTRVIAETLGCKESSVSVAIKDVEEADWKEFLSLIHI